MPRPRCPRCTRPLSLCLCGRISCLPSRTRVIILQHPEESRHALNTARLAALALPNASLKIAPSFAEEDWAVAGKQAWLLFPAAQARVLGEDAFVGEGDVLVVPDASWRKARGMVQSNPALAALPRVTLPAGLPARYRVRHADAPDALSTLEAIAYALTRIEGTSFDAMLAPLEALVRQQIEGMGEARYRLHHVLRQGTRSRRLGKPE